MSKVSYTSLKLKTDTTTKIYNFKDSNIEVLQYLPFEDKYDLVEICLQKAQEGNLYSQMKADMFFHLYLVIMYTNITFTEKQRENEVKLYDALKSCGLLDEILMLIPEDEYNFLYQSMEQRIADNLKYKHSAAAVLESFVTDLPTNADAAAKIVDSFDPAQYQAVIDFARAANGNRAI